MANSYLPSFSTECSEDNLFLCSDSAQNEAVCVSELQVCDGIEHCPNGSDELMDCSTGYIIHHFDMTLYIMTWKGITNTLFSRVYYSRPVTSCEWRYY